MRDDWNSDGIGSIVNLFNSIFDSLYTQVGDNLTQVDNIDGDPLLTWNYHLSAASPCSKAGNNDAPGLPDTDMDGDARKINGDGIGDATVDIGADEYEFIDTDNDGVQDSEEMGPDGNDPSYDGNDDTIPDSQQNKVASMHTHNDEGYVTVASPAGTSLRNVRAIVPPGTSPIGVNFEYGCFVFAVTGVGIGGSASVTFFGPDDAVFDTYYKYGPTFDNPAPHWYEFLFDGETGAVINGNQITLHLVDGQRGDGDLTENGEIVEPGGPAIITAENCEGDCNGDGDVDGSDLAELVDNPARLDLTTFAIEFGRTVCPASD